MNSKERLNSLLARVGQGEHIGLVETRFTESLIGSPKLDLAILANLILMVSGSGRKKMIAMRRLSGICSKPGLWNKQAALASMATALLYFPKKQLQKQPRVLRFVYRAAKHRFLPARLNATNILHILGKAGDPKAIALLKEAVADSHAYVRATAQSALTHLR